MTLLKLPDWGHHHEGLTTQRLQKRTNEMDRPIVSRQRMIKIIELVFHAGLPTIHRLQDELHLKKKRD